MSKGQALRELAVLLKRGCRSRCPQCGIGKLFQSWNILKIKCENCGCALRAREDETWFFMYMSTAGITGLFIIFMLLVTPKNQLMAKILITLAAIGIFIVTTGPRKGIALAIDYFIDSHSEFPRY